MAWRTRSPGAARATMPMLELPEPSHGEVWTVVLDPIRGHEQGGLRPAVVISNDRFNRAFETVVIIVPFTRTNRGTPTQIPVHPPEGRLTSPSLLMCEQVRAVSITRFRGRRGTVSDQTLAKVEVLIAELITRHHRIGGCLIGRSHSSSGYRYRDHRGRRCAGWPREPPRPRFCTIALRDRSARPGGGRLLARILLEPVDRRRRCARDVRPGGTCASRLP